MPHYLITLRAEHDAEPSLQERAGASLTALREVSAKTEGQLVECWSAFDGKEIVALFRSSEAHAESRISEFLAEASPAFSQQVTLLTSLRELFPQSNDISLDPVDIGSDLSFPASDVPAWPEKTKNRAEQ
jgi:hypothetical protein